MSESTTTATGEESTADPVAGTTEACVFVSPTADFLLLAAGSFLLLYTGLVLLI